MIPIELTHDQYWIIKIIRQLQTNLLSHAKVTK